MDEETKKKHRAKAAGKKAQRKKDKNKKTDDEATARQRNPKAFSIQNINKAAKKFHRSQDVKQKKIHIPLPDRSVLEPPPVVVAIVGPPRVGKTTLLQCIVRNFTKQKVTNIKGPVTVVSGKKRRLTLIEVDNDINKMIDIAKVADLVILMIDASFGFEMEVFEFLNICQVHGFPKVMGVLNHLDTFRDSKRVRKTKKRLKDRFWAEIYQGAKLFYLSGMVEGEYQKMEVHNLCRFISVMKFRPLSWRSTHPFILADRMEDITPPEQIEVDKKCDRRVTIYGYNRGLALKHNQAIHIAGVGDFRIASMESLPDPCPTPEMEKRRSLNQRERLVYAPMSGVGGVLYDKDAVYINVGGSHYLQQEDDEEMTPVKELVSSLIGTVAPPTEDDQSSEDESSMPTEQLLTSGGRVRRRAVFDDEKQDDNADDKENSSSDDDDDDESDDEAQFLNNKENDKEDGDEVDSEGDENDDDDGGDDDDEEDKASSDEDEEEEEDDDSLPAGFSSNWQRRTDLSKMIYGHSDNEEEEEQEEGEEEEKLGGLFRVLKKKREEGKQLKYNADLTDCSKFAVSTSHDWQMEEVRGLIADCFVTGRWDRSEDAVARLQDDDELYGDFEDLETGEKHTVEMGDEDDDDKDEDDGDDDKGDDGAASQPKKRKADMTAEERRQARLEKKKRRKEEFDALYDVKTDGDDDFYQAWKAEMEEQAKLNRAEFENLSEEMRQNLEGFRPGLYMRMEVSGVPCEFVKHFDPAAPLVIGGLTNLEENVGYVQARFKKHRWYKKILKTRNPLVLSLGWRRFQTIPVYSVQEHNMRYRMLKYTPEHLHCMASFWGPITPQGSGILAVENVSEVSSGFRIAGTGVVLELDKSVEIVKKLKLTGTPYKIFKKTAYIQGMFNSQLEVAKFEGAKVSTVSKVRGVVKKGARRLADTGAMLPDGTFRATFEDRILLSDIVFLRAWYPVEVPQYYNPVTTLLGAWHGMKTVGQLRFERGIAVPQNQDSLYKPVERGAKRFKPLVIPRGLQKELPFKVTPKNQGPAAPTPKRVPIISEPAETKKTKFLHMLKTIHEYQQRQKHAIMRQRAHKHQQMLAKRAAKRDSMQKKKRAL